MRAPLNRFRSHRSSSPVTLSDSITRTRNLFDIALNPPVASYTSKGDPPYTRAFNLKLRSIRYPLLSGATFLLRMSLRLQMFLRPLQPMLMDMPCGVPPSHSYILYSSPDLMFMFSCLSPRCLQSSHRRSKKPSARTHRFPCQYWWPNSTRSRCCDHGRGHCRQINP